MSEFLRYVLWELRRYFVLAVLAGVLALGGFLLYRFWHQRKFGEDKRIPWKRVLLSVLFAGYLAMVFFVTNFRAAGMGRQVNLHLFRAWREALNHFSQQRWLNVLLNIAMFGPFGFLLPLFGRKFQKWYVTIPAGFGFSLCLEVLQYLFARGIFDVDDLFCNTLGGTIGFFGAMVLLSIPGRQWRKFSIHGCMVLASFGAVGAVFLGYAAQEFGNLPEAPAYRVNTRGTEWNIACEMPDVGTILPAYQTNTRTIEDCDSFAERFKGIIRTEFDDISYYQEAAYYMDHGNGDGAHFLFVRYLDQGWEYTAIYDTAPEWMDADRETIENVLKQYPLFIPETAEFTVEGDGWHQFRVSLYSDGAAVYDGVLRVRIGADGLIREIDNRLLSYDCYRDVAVISPQEALEQLQAGKFQDEGYFEHSNPRVITVLSCALEYRVDTKGYYQPVYVFAVASPEGSYRDSLLIPAME